MHLKNILFLSLSITILQSCKIKKIEDKVITKEEVSRVIKTLSDDAMMGRSALKPEQIGKAADFIADEFKDAHLKFFGNAKTYRQNFIVTKIKPNKGILTVNNKLINANNYAVSSSWGDVKILNFLSVISIDKGDNFSVKFREALASNVDVLVKIDPSFSETFIRFKKYLDGGSMSFDATSGTTAVFVVTEENIESASLTYNNEITKFPMFNVVGVLPGKSLRNEYVVFSSHYDHLGVIKSVGQDSIANGADDDASGTTAVIELAKYFAKRKDNERTLIFVAFTAEEIGGYGSQYFSKQLDADKTVAMFNIEMIGKESKFGKNNAFITGYERSDFGEILQKNLEATEFKFYPDPYPEQNLFYRSDNATLARLGVPAHTISSDQIDTDKLYHSVDDEFESMDIGNITEIIKAIAISSKSIVEGKDTPTRVTGVK